MFTNRRKTAENQIRLKENQQLFDHWQNVRFGQSTPRRSNLNMRVLGPILGHVAILEQDVEGEKFYFRLAGTELRNYFGRELTGCDFLDPWGKNDCNALAAMLRLTVTDARPIIVRFIIQTADRRSEIIEALFLPMAEQGQIIASFAMATAPYWLGSQHIEKQWVLSICMIDGENIVAQQAPLKEGESQPRREEPLVLVSTDPSGSGKAAWPGFRVIPGGRK